MAFFNNQEAFGLPKGTVRATVLLLLTVTMCRMAADHGEAAAALIAAFGTAAGFYFGAKPTNGSKNGEESPHAPTAP